MKNRIPVVLAASSLAIGLSMSSCVAPYDAYGPTTVTGYSPGYRANSLPQGYRTEIIGGNTYYYHNGAYYRSRSGSYVVVDAPRSSRYYRDYDQYNRRSHRNQNVNVITRLPSGYRAVTVQGETYYQHRNSYYRRHGNGYTGVARPF